MFRKNRLNDVVPDELKNYTESLTISVASYGIWKIVLNIGVIMVDINLLQRHTFSILQKMHTAAKVRVHNNIIWNGKKWNIFSG